MATASVTSPTKAALRRIPGLVATYRHVQLLSAVAYERWSANPRKANDNAILSGAWHFATPAEQRRYEDVLAAAAAVRGPAPWGDVLEIGCAEGAFTREIVRQSASVTAYDVSPVACERTASAFPGVRVQRIDIGRDPLPGTFDIVFLMCVLGSLHGRRTLGRVSANLAGALRPGGLLVFNELRFHEPRMEASWWARALVEGGLQLLTFLDGREELCARRQEIHPRYVIGVYAKAPPPAAASGRGRT